MRLTREATYAPHKWLDPKLKVKVKAQLRALTEGNRVVVIEEGSDNIFFDGSRELFNACMARGHFKEAT